MPDAFFVIEDDGRFRATEWTIGPWSRDSQHGGPPAALLGRAIERAVARDDAQVVRATFEILRPIPLTSLEVVAEVGRPGRSVVLTEASLTDADGVIMRARAWSIRTGDVGLPQVLHDAAPPAPPVAGEKSEVFGPDEPNYLHAMEWRFLRGSFVEPGPAIAWARMRLPLVDGEDVTPLTRALVLADSGNGISSMLDFSRWLFINADLTVYLHRLPRGEWVCLDAQTTVQPTGVGLAASILSDEEGAIGRGMQSLLITPRR